MMLCSSVSAILFLSTPSARRATQDITKAPQTLAISIHALREEGDSSTNKPKSIAISFLSTPSARRATIALGYFVVSLVISIHALREEGDAIQRPHVYEKLYFYPRPPRGGRRQVHHGKARCLCISIHALREEGDSCSSLRLRGAFNFYPRPPRGGRPPGRRDTAGHWNFYPRPPRGGRPISMSFAKAFLRFLSTPSARRATYRLVRLARFDEISIHALREEGDLSPATRNSIKKDFYPRPPRGGRLTADGESHRVVMRFLSTPSARRATRPRY